MRILNIGCGEDLEYGTDFVDLYPCEKRIIRCDIDHEHLPYDDSVFDEVFSQNLLEHLLNKGFALSEMARVLKPKGRLVITTDNGSYWGYGLDNGSHTGLNERFGRGPCDCHFCFFSEYHLKNLLNRYGFSDIKVEFLFDDMHNLVVRWINRFLSRTFLYRLGYSKMIVSGYKSNFK